MKTQFKNSKVLSTTTLSKEYKNYHLKGDRYWDEGIKFYPYRKKGFKNPNKTIMKFQVRMYKTWKHNRKTQWK